MGLHVKEVDSGTHKGRRSSRPGGPDGNATTDEHGCHRRKGYYPLTSLTEVPTRAIRQRCVEDTRHATLQQPGKKAYSKICSISDRSVSESVSRVGKERPLLDGRLEAGERLFHRRSMKKNAVKWRGDHLRIWIKVLNSLVLSHRSSSRIRRDLNM